MRSPPSHDAEHALYSSRAHSAVAPCRNVSPLKTTTATFRVGPASRSGAALSSPSKISERPHSRRRARSASTMVRTTHAAPASFDVPSAPRHGWCSVPSGIRATTAAAIVIASLRCNSRAFRSTSSASPPASIARRQSSTLARTPPRHNTTVHAKHRIIIGHGAARRLGLRPRRPGQPPSRRPGRPPRRCRRRGGKADTRIVWLRYWNNFGGASTIGPQQAALFDHYS